MPKTPIRRRSGEACEQRRSWPRGELETAASLARESIVRADTTDFLHLRWHVHASAGDVLLRGGNPLEAERC